MYHGNIPVVEHTKKIIRTDSAWPALCYIAPIGCCSIIKPFFIVIPLIAWPVGFIKLNHDMPIKNELFALK